MSQLVDETLNSAPGKNCMKYLITALIVPFLDLWLLMEVTSMIGFWRTLALVLLTGIVGVAMVKDQIKLVLRKLSTSATSKEISRNLIETFLLVFGGFLLIVPGLITDFLGLMLALRPVRERIAVRISESLESNFEVEVASF